MSSELLEEPTGPAVNAALRGAALLPVIAFAVLSLKRRQCRSPPVRLSSIFLRIFPVVFGIGVLLAVTSSSIVATNLAGTGISGRVDVITLYLEITALFLLTVADIVLTITVYLVAIAILYLCLGRLKWWAIFRLDAIIGAGLCLVLAIAWWGRNMALIGDWANGRGRNSSNAIGLVMGWLLFLVQLVLAILTLASICIVAYATSKLKHLPHIAAKKTTTLYLVVGTIWLVRCVYSVAIWIKNMIPDWTEDELGAFLIFDPILDLWLTAAVFALFVVITRQRIWSDSVWDVIHAQSHTTQHPASAYPTYAAFPQQGNAHYTNGAALQQPAYGQPTQNGALHQYPAYAPPQQFVQPSSQGHFPAAAEAPKP